MSATLICEECICDMTAVQNPCCIERCIWIDSKPFLPLVSPCSCDCTSSFKQDNEPNVLGKSSCNHQMSTATLPDCLSLQTTKIGTHVKTKKKLSPRTVFGPLMSPLIVNSGQTGLSSVCHLKYWLDTSEAGDIYHYTESDCNWMKHVRFVPSSSDANLLAFRYNGQIYFMSFRKIAAGEELKVTYSLNYRCHLPPNLLAGIDGVEQKAEQEEFRERITESPKRVLRPRRNPPPAKPEPPSSSSCSEDDEDSSASQSDSEESTSSDTNSVASEPEPQSRKRRRASKKSSTLENAVDLDGKQEKTLQDNNDTENPTSTGAPVMSKYKLRVERQGYRLRCTHCKAYFAKRQDRIRKHWLTCPKLTTGESSIAHIACPYCPEHFSTYSERIAHLSEHQVEGKLPCPQCGGLFGDWDKVQRHIYSVHSGKRKGEKSRHKEKKKVDGAETSVETSDVAETSVRKRGIPDTTQTDVEKPKESAWKRKKRVPSKCDVCGHIAPSRRELIKHKETVHATVTRFVCKHCGKDLHAYKRLNRHLEIFHTDNGEQSSTTRRIPRRHIKKDDYDAHIFKCELCRLSFFMRMQLVEHLTNVHPELSHRTIPILNLPMVKHRAYRCIVCNKKNIHEDKALNHARRNHTMDDLAAAQAKRGDLQRNGKLPSEENAVVHDGFSICYDSEVYSCEVCNERIETTRDFLHHVKRYHPAYHDVLMPNAAPDVKYMPWKNKKWT